MLVFASERKQDVQSRGRQGEKFVLAWVFLHIRNPLYRFPSEFVKTVLYMRSEHLRVRANRLERPYNRLTEAQWVIL